MNAQTTNALRHAADSGDPIDHDTALAILDASGDDLPEILQAATAVRRHHFPARANLCAIVNAKSGECSEDCRFCAQSAHFPAKCQTQPMLTADEILRVRGRMDGKPLAYFSIVTSGKGATDEELDHICKTIAQSPPGPPHWCASLGVLSREQLRRLKDAGLVRYHHNLEAAESFFPSVCTTHTYADRVETVRAARDVGLKVCSGGIFGIGESRGQRVELAEALAGESVDSIPLNFLIPVKGTPLADAEVLTPLEILKTIAMFRLIAPRAEVRICGGRAHLGSLQPLLFLAGAIGMMIGDLLTVEGGPIDADIQMPADLGWGFDVP